ncbi:MAG: PDZ domain-containing protein [Fimbriimonadaceae bacterium]|nr:PDZ domain-containing protein [Fimbriimonadaceae bacterium]
MVLSGLSTQLSPTEASAWSRIAPSIVVLLDGDQERGAAALIDSGGLFVAHKESVAGTQVRGRASTGAVIVLKVLSSDDPSQLVLLGAEGWKSGANPVSASRRDARPGERLLAALGSGPIRAEFVSADRVGVVNPSRRVVQLNEIRFEAPADSVGGALIFTLNGELLGTLNATLEQIDESPQQAGFGGLSRDLLPKTRQQENRFGPGAMTVAYTVGPVALRRVLDGFRSPSHEVIHPSLGVFCRDAPGAGAVVEMVQAGSSANMAGLRPGDIIFQLNGSPVKNQIDFAKLVFEQEVGSIIPMRVRRGASTVLMMVRVGRLEEE